MSFILDGLFIGDLDDALNGNKLKSNGVTHVLTLDMKPLPLDKRECFQYKYIHALDMEDFDLLASIPEAVDFIEDGRKAGGVLVHCFAGQSRSVAAVLAYLMQKLDLSLNDAFTLVKKHRPGIGPNSGFLQQLELYERMENTVNIESQLYKQYRLQNLALQVQSAQIVGSLPAESLSQDPSIGASPQGMYYKCRKCRRPLFKKSAKLDHEEGLGECAFTWQKSLGQRIDAPICHKSIFIEPVQWMEQDLHHIEGKLMCPKCSAKLGSFKWTGEQCPCGTWVTPAFHIQTNKVDEAKQQHQRPIQLRNQPVLRPSKGFQISVGIETADNIDDNRQGPPSGDGNDLCLDRKNTNSEVSEQTVSDSLCTGKNVELENKNSGLNADKICSTNAHSGEEKSETKDKNASKVAVITRHRKPSEREESLQIVTGLGEAVAKCNLRQDEDLPPL